MENITLKNLTDSGNTIFDGVLKQLATEIRRFRIDVANLETKIDSGGPVNFYREKAYALNQTVDAPNLRRWIAPEYKDDPVCLHVSSSGGVGFGCLTSDVRHSKLSDLAAIPKMRWAQRMNERRVPIGTVTVFFAARAFKLPSENEQLPLGIFVPSWAKPEEGEYAKMRFSSRVNAIIWIDSKQKSHFFAGYVARLANEKEIGCLTSNVHQKALKAWVGRSRMDCFNPTSRVWLMSLVTPIEEMIEEDPEDSDVDEEPPGTGSKIVKRREAFLATVDLPPNAPFSKDQLLDFVTCNASKHFIYWTPQRTMKIHTFDSSTAQWKDTVCVKCFDLLVEKVTVSEKKADVKEKKEDEA